MTASRNSVLLVRARSWPARLALVFGASLLLWLSAKVQVPFWPVPMTMQTLALLVLAAVLGRDGVAAAALYLAEGAAGLPVFAGTPEKGLGLAYMMGPTGGYLLGFLLAAAFIAWMVEKGHARGPARLIAVMLAGGALVYLPGIAWLSSFVGVEKAVALGLTPFVLGDVLKALLAAAVVHAFARVRRS